MLRQWWCFLSNLTETISDNETMGNFEGYDSTEIQLGRIRKLLFLVAAGMGFLMEVGTMEDIDWSVDTMGVQLGI